MRNSAAAVRSRQVPALIGLATWSGCSVLTQVRSASLSPWCLLGCPGRSSARLHQPASAPLAADRQRPCLRERGGSFGCPAQVLPTHCLCAVGPQLKGRHAVPEHLADRSGLPTRLSCPAAGLRSRRQAELQQQWPMFVAMSGSCTLRTHVPVGKSTGTVCRVCFGQPPPSVLTDSGSSAIPRMQGSPPAACSRTKNASGACAGQHRCGVQRRPVLSCSLGD